MAYSIPNSRRYLSASGIYPHSGSQIPRGFLPKYFSYVCTPTAICAFTVFSLTYKIGKYPCVAPHVIISKTPISWKCLNCSIKLHLKTSLNKCKSFEYLS